MKIITIKRSYNKRRFIIFFHCWLVFLFLAIPTAQAQENFQNTSTTIDTLKVDLNKSIIYDRYSSYYDEHNKEDNKENKEEKKATTAPGDYKEYIETLDLKADLKDWLLRVIHCESRGNPQAINSTEIIIGGVSYGHAEGLMQIIPSTWKRFGCEGNVFNAIDSINCGIKAYNMGRQSEWSCK